MKGMLEDTETYLRYFTGPFEIYTTLSGDIALKHEDTVFIQFPRQRMGISQVSALDP